MSEDEKNTSTRDKLREHMRIAGLPQSQIAPKIGVSTTVLSRWLADDYGGDNDAVNAAVVKFLELQIQRISAAVRDVGYVQTETSEKIARKLTHAQVCADIVMIYGHPGASKTSACAEYAKRHPQIWHVELSPATKNVVTCLESICEVMGLTPSGGAARVSNQIVKHMRGTEGLLIIDEFQHASLDAIEQIRAIYDKAKVGLALVGNKGAWTQLLTGPRAEKLERMLSRVGSRLELKRSTKADVLAYIAAWGVTGDCRNRLIEIGQGKGAIRSLAKTLKLAARYAATQRVELCCEHIDAAHAEMSGVE